MENSRNVTKRLNVTRFIFNEIHDEYQMIDQKSVGNERKARKQDA